MFKAMAYLLGEEDRIKVSKNFSKDSICFTSSAENLRTNCRVFNTEYIFISKKLFTFELKKFLKLFNLLNKTVILDGEKVLGFSNLRKDIPMFVNANYILP